MKEDNNEIMKDAGRRGVQILASSPGSLVGNKSFKCSEVSY